MNSIIEQMLAQHPSATQNDKKNSIKEVVYSANSDHLSRSNRSMLTVFQTNLHGQETN